MKIKPIRIIVVIAYISMIFLNYFIADVGQQSDRFTTFVTPAGYTFAIWSVIFLGTGAFSVYQVLPRTQNDKLLDRLAPLVIGTYLTTGAWVPIFTQDFFITANVVMVGILATLIGIYLIIRNSGQLSTTEQWVIKIPFSIFLGWITVATVANTALTLKAYEWGAFGLSETVWAVAILIVAGLIASIVVYYGRGDIAYALTLVWALGGIIVANLARPIVLSAAVAMAVLIVAVLIYTRMTGAAQPSQTPAGSPSLT